MKTIIVVLGLALASSACSSGASMVQSNFVDKPGSPTALDESHVVVWSNHAEVEPIILQWLREAQSGLAPDPRMQMLQGLREAQPVLAPDPRMQMAFADLRGELKAVPDDADIIELARRVGADHVLIAEVAIKPAGNTSGSFTYLAVQRFAIQSRALVWSSAVHCSRPVTNPQPVLRQLVPVALAIGARYADKGKLIARGTRICREE
jgi:hypothetical protein